MLYANSEHKPLTAKEKAFADYIIAHDTTCTLLAAYRHAYKTKDSDKGAYRNAYNVSIRPHVRAYIANAKAESRNAAILTRTECMEFLSNLVKRAADGELIHIRDQIAAIEKLSKLEGWDKAQKLDLGGVTFNINTTGAASP
jgi:hypothetical protein